MVFVVFASLLCILTAHILRSNMVGNGTIAFSGFNGIGVVVGFVIYVATAALIGKEFGVPIISALLLHELGQVLAYRMLGHKRARFRMVPLFSKTPISDLPLKTDGEYFFVAIMGPAFCLGPMALSMAIAVALNPFAPVSAQSFYYFALTCGAVNFVSLLPFWPLAGGRCARAAVVDFWPALVPAITVFMSAALATASLRTGSLLLMAMAGVGAHSLWRRERSTRTPMHPDTGLIALSAYVFTMAAHFSAAWLLFEAYF